MRTMDGISVEDLKRLLVREKKEKLLYKVGIGWIMCV
jgi:hypothetical protein